MSSDLDILKQFVLDEPVHISNQEPALEAGPHGLDMADLIQPADEPPAPVLPGMHDDDIETLRARVQTAEIARDEAQAKLAATEIALEELALFRHPNFSKVKKHVQAGGWIYLYPIGISQAGRDAVYIAANQIMEIQKLAALEKYIPIFSVDVRDISTQKRTI